MVLSEDKKEGIIGYSSSAATSLLSIAQTNEVFQLIQLIVSIAVSLLTTAYIVWKWYKNAKKDGKITPDEVEDLFKNLMNNVNEEEKKNE